MFSLSEDLLKNYQNKSKDYFAVQMCVFISVAYLMISSVVYILKEKYFFLILSYFTFMVQQAHMMVRYSPLSNKEGMTQFTNAQLI